MDYQNVHLTAHNLFGRQNTDQKHNTLIDPLLYAEQLIQARNRSQVPGHDHASLARVLVYRGLPSAEHDARSYARNLSQKAHWERDPRVELTHRPLKYIYQRDAGGRPARERRGDRIVVGREEKGVLMLCALALVRAASSPEVGVAVLASSDSDLEPALDEALRLGSAKVETVSWRDPAQRLRWPELRPTDRSCRLWNTRLGRPEFELARDHTKYD